MLKVTIKTNNSVIAMGGDRTHNYSGYGEGLWLFSATVNNIIGRETGESGENY